jgi:hypothetical protein
MVEEDEKIKKEIEQITPSNEELLKLANNCQKNFEGGV